MTDDTPTDDAARDGQHGHNTQDDDAEQTEISDDTDAATDTFGRTIRYVDPTDRAWQEAHAFAGIGTPAFSEEPDSYDDARADSSVTETRGPLTDAITTLDDHFSVTTRSVAFRDDVNAWRETQRHIALVNPATDALYHIPTRQYSPATPRGLFGSLIDVLTDRDLTPFGEVRVRRGGGDQHLDVFFADDSTTVEHEISDGETVELVLGFEISHDYFGGKRHTASPIALDTSTGAVYRDILPDRRRKHTGNAVEDVGAWYADIIDLLQSSTDRLAQAIADANGYEFDTVTDPDVPIDTERLYALMGFPARDQDSLATCAGQRLSALMRGDFDGSTSAPTAWQVFRAGADAITHDYDVTLGGGAVTERVSALNRVLFTPASAERDVLVSARDELVDSLDDTEREALDEGLETFVDDGTLAEHQALSDRLDDLDGSVSSYKTVKERLNAIMTAGANSGEQSTSDEQDSTDDSDSSNTGDDEQDDEQAVADGGTSATDRTLSSFTGGHDDTTAGASE